MSATTTARFQWRLYDGSEQRWSREHATDGPCTACCCQVGPVDCEDCGGRNHREPVEGLTADGWEVVHTWYCQREQGDQVGDQPETREVTP